MRLTACSREDRQQLGQPTIELRGISREAHAGCAIEERIRLERVQEQDRVPEVLHAPVAAEMGLGFMELEGAQRLQREAVQCSSDARPVGPIETDAHRWVR